MTSQDATAPGVVIIRAVQDNPAAASRRARIETVARSVRSRSACSQMFADLPSEATPQLRWSSHGAANL